jgi:radical SAM protein with 4Fe4S-binding SPASM domain
VLYLFARRLGLKVMLFTNARLITPHLADLFAQIPPRVPIEVTVYGMTPASYEAVTRAPGSFASFWRGVNHLLEHSVPFIVKSALLPQNKNEIELFETWAGSIPWMTHRPTYAMNFDLRNRPGNAAKNAQIAALRISPEETVTVLARDEERIRRTLTEFAAKFIGPPGDQLFRCGANSGHSMCVDAYGRAQPCMGLTTPDLTVDLFPLTAGMAHMDQALNQFARLGELRAVNPEYLRRCARCFLKGLCEQCPARSWAENGTLDTPVEYLCQIAHAKACFMGWLGENEMGWEVADWKTRIGQE